MQFGQIWLMCHKSTKSKLKYLNTLTFRTLTFFHYPELLDMSVDIKCLDQIIETVNLGLRY